MPTKRPPCRGHEGKRLLNAVQMPNSVQLEEGVLVRLERDQARTSEISIQELIATLDEDGFSHLATPALMAAVLS